VAVRIGDSITVIPFLHGRAVFSRVVRETCLTGVFDCIVVDLPAHFAPYLPQLIDTLPVVSGLVAREQTGPSYLLPGDPCDATIEAVRQSFGLHVPFFCAGFPTCEPSAPLPPLPDEQALVTLGPDAYCTLCIETIAATAATDPLDDLHGRHIAATLRHLGSRFRSILAVLHLRRLPQVYRCFTAPSPADTAPFPTPPSYSITCNEINPDHLYFALGELPFFTGKYERERYDPFAAPFDPITALKELFCETRDDKKNDSKQEDVAPLSPVRLQAALTFLRNLAVLDKQLLPSLFDIVEAARAVGGNRYALAILTNARYYPWFSLDNRTGMLGVGIHRIRVPEWGCTGRVVNLLCDRRLFWRSIELRPDPSRAKKQEYRYQWNPFGMCSHIPEDRAIERFNGVVRKKALRIAVEDHVLSEKFTTSVKDGIDIRETLRAWYTGDIYVRELPPSRRTVDAVVIVFDADNDERYPHRGTWYAEHPDESTLAFYATDPFEQLLGPGIARSTYGGLLLLFPPRPVPDIFTLDTGISCRGCADQLVLGALLFGSEKIVAYVAERPPGGVLVNLARCFRKRLIWVPLSTFSRETIVRLRSFHILNGKEVRSWAARFIGD
jgi:hypothetical protein